MCPLTRECLMLYHDGELDAQETARVELLLSQCEDCRRELEKIRQLDNIINEAKQAERLTPDESAAYYRGVCRKLNRQRPSLILHSFALVLVLVGTLIFLTLPSKPVFHILGISALLGSMVLVGLGQYCRCRS